MPTAKGGYFLADGTRVPSVTTILSRFKDAGPLMYWAWNEGKEGRDFRETRDSAANAGTLAHAAVEAWARGQEPVWNGEPATVAKAQTAYAAFREWAAQTRLEIAEQELPLVSEKYRFGGTFDAILVGGKRAMGDWKTSNGIYPDHLMQLAAYGKLWEEHRPDEPLEGGFHLLKFDKTHGDFTHKWWGNLDKAWEGFLHLRAMYDIDKILKARVR